MMDRNALRQVIANSVGNPTNGIVADVLDTITDAVCGYLSPSQETRIMEPTETR